MESTMITRRSFLTVLGGGIILAAAGGTYVVTRKPTTALQPWWQAGQPDDPRRRALSYALLAPNPHNRQPWLVDLSVPDQVTLYVDLNRLLPQTDPLNRQITIGLGGFLELMRMAAAEQGYRVDITAFPEGSAPEGLDARPIATARFAADPATLRDPLFAHVMQRRSNKEPFDTSTPVTPDTLALILAASPLAGGSVTEDSIAALRSLTHAALATEIATPHTFQESVDLFRIGAREVDANPDGIDFTGPLFEGMHATGLFTRASAADPSSSAYQAGLDAVFANTDTAMGHVWLITPTNTRLDQIATGAHWLRLNLAATAVGIATQPLSQALQEFPEMAAHYRAVHDRLAPSGGTVQMLARVGFGPQVTVSPRWPLDAKVIRG
jgi:hypothetical protein